MQSTLRPTISSSSESADDESLASRVESRLRRLILSWPFAAAVVVVVLSIWDGARTSLPIQVSGAQKDIYITSVGVGATMLGFTLAALSFLVALPEDRPLLQRIRDEGLHGKVLRSFAVSAAYLALMAFVAFVGLFFDRQPDRQLTGHELGTCSYWIWALVAVLVPSIAWLARSLRALADVIPVVVAATRKR